MANDKTNFNMQLTQTQKEIMDFVTEVIFDGRNYSKADTVIHLFRNVALNYLGFDDLKGRFSDESLLSFLKQYKFQEDLNLIAMIGIERYEKFIEDSKEKGLNTSYNEELLKEYKLKKGEK